VALLIADVYKQVTNWHWRCCRSHGNLGL